MHSDANVPLLSTTAEYDNDISSQTESIDDGTVDSADYGERLVWALEKKFI